MNHFVFDVIYYAFVFLTDPSFVGLMLGTGLGVGLALVGLLSLYLTWTLGKAAINLLKHASIFVHLLGLWYQSIKDVTFENTADRLPNGERIIKSTVTMSLGNNQNTDELVRFYTRKVSVSRPSAVPVTTTTSSAPVAATTTDVPAADAVLFSILSDAAETVPVQHVQTPN
ncbi:hypothetical protein [Mollivirus kamchatka]|nr:hypothetical protein [Mollivirus kamchatka]